MIHAILLLVASALAAKGMRASEAGFVPLFNDRDLSGWINVNGAPETWNNRGGLITCTGRPISMLRTERQYENFVLEVEWRHLTAGGNSGMFVWASPLPARGVPFLRGIEVQMLDNARDAEGKNVRYTTHGDIFPTHGATMRPLGRTNGRRAFPSEERSKSAPAWNHYRVTCVEGTITLAVNGKEVTAGAECVYRKGYIALESEGAPVEFRNLRLKELPAAAVSVDAAAPLDQSWRSLFTGMDLRGWKTEAPSAWSVSNERIVRSAPDGNAAVGPLISESVFAQAQFIVDVKAESAAAKVTFHLRTRDETQAMAIPLPAIGDRSFERLTITVADRGVSIESTGGDAVRHTFPPNFAPPFAMGFDAERGGFQLMNLFVRHL